MELPKVDLEFLRTVPTTRKVLFLVIVVGAIVGMFYNYVAVDKQGVIERLQKEIGKLDAEKQTLLVKVKHLDLVRAAVEQLGIELEKKKEMLPPAEEAVALLKQMSDLGTRLGLDIRLWKPKGRVMDASQLFVKMPVDVEVSGGYHTAALFFDRIQKLPRIMNVTNLRMGSAKLGEDRVQIKTTFVLTAYVAPPEQ
ncbi:MAG: type 4a pilus biogenesis protein PilO, partial [Nitrospirota bacterium]|nr:type 4a pilus biogenesis protein PilO [Nitrospirota bacterium]